ncbi:WXG100 family type VII secretion target [Actinoallomurus sp. NPDC052274]|uniref:WXG100 family type VII secretion target n=1 Tax=Actinoallomurus sp. NPDC052274 TaxID=3155420 RepID=UPI003422495E
MGVDHHTYVIKSGGRPQGAGSYGSPDDIRELIAGTHPGSITDAAQAYDAIGNAIIEAQNALWDAAKVLADYWSGPAAEAAQLVLRRLYGTAGELVVRSNETAKTLQWYGGSILPMYRSINWPKKNTDSPAAIAAADQVMRNLNERIAQTWDGMPSQIEKNLPQLSERGDQPSGDIPSENPGGKGAGEHGDAGSVRVPRGHVSLPHTGKTHYGSPNTPGGPSTLPEPGGADLAGGTPPPSGSLSSGLGPASNSLPPGIPGGPASGPGPSGIGDIGLGGVGGSFRSGDFRPGVGKPGTPGETEALGSSRSAGGRPSVGVGRSNEIGTPAPSGGGRSDEKERERTAWLAEDRDLWTVGADAVPGVIGDAPNLLRQSAQDEDELLTVDELQELLDLVDEPAKETGEEFSQPSTVHSVGDPNAYMGEQDFIHLDGDLIDPDHGTPGIQRA